jgi:hypothetical protein
MLEPNVKEQRQGAKLLHNQLRGRPPVGGVDLGDVLVGEVVQQQGHSLHDMSRSEVSGGQSVGQLVDLLPQRAERDGVCRALEGVLNGHGQFAGFHPQLADVSVHGVAIRSPPQHLDAMQQAVTLLLESVDQAGRRESGRDVSPLQLFDARAKWAGVVGHAPGLLE